MPNLDSLKPPTPGTDAAADTWTDPNFPPVQEDSENTFIATVEDIGHPGSRRELMLDDPSQLAEQHQQPGKKRGVSRRSFGRWALQFGTAAVGATTGGIIGGRLRDGEIADLRHEQDARLHEAAMNRVALGTHNLEVLYNLSDAARAPALEIWGSSKDAHAEKVALEIEQDAALRTNTVAAFRYACQAMQKRNYTTDPSQGGHRLSTGDLFYALGLAYNPGNRSTVSQDIYSLNQLTGTQAFVSHIAENVARYPEFALQNASLLQGMTEQFAIARNLPPRLVATLRDPSIRLGPDSAATILIQTYSTVDVALTNTATDIGVAFDTSNSGW